MDIVKPLEISPVGEGVAADHDRHQTGNLRNGAGEKALDGGKASVERWTLCERCHGHRKKYGEESSDSKR